MMAVFAAVSLLLAQVVSRAADLDVRPAATPAGGLVYSAWGGGTVALPVAVEGTPGTPYRLAGTLFQSAAGGLSARIGESRDLGAGILTDSARRDLVVEIPVPAVERPAQFVFQTSILREGENAPASSFRADIFTWPRVEAAERGRVIVSALKAAGLRLVLFGETEALRDFLRASRVDFEEGGRGMPESAEPGAVYVGSVSAPERDRLVDLRGRWIIICDGPTPWPGVYRTVAGGADVTKISLPGFLRLGDDAAAATYFEKLLVEVITSTVTPIVP